MKDLKISVCLTNYNRSNLLFEAVANIVMDERVDEVVISDDCSDEKIYQTVLWQFKDFPKVKIYRNESNIDCYRNKARSLELAVNDWCCLWDSDNIFDKSYIDRIESLVEAGLSDRTA